MPTRSGLPPRKWTTSGRLRTAQYQNRPQPLPARPRAAETRCPNRSIKQYGVRRHARIGAPHGQRISPGRATWMRFQHPHHRRSAPARCPAAPGMTSLTLARPQAAPANSPEGAAPKGATSLTRYPEMQQEEPGAPPSTPSTPAACRARPRRPRSCGSPPACCRMPRLCRSRPRIFCARAEPLLGRLEDLVHHFGPRRDHGSQLVPVDSLGDVR